MGRLLDLVESLEPPTVAIFRGTATDAFDLAIDWQRDGILALRLSGNLMTSRKGYLREHATVLQFPPYFGNNLDALDECLADLGWLPDGPIVLVVLNAARVLTDAGDRTLADAISAWTAAANSWIGQGRPFHVVLQVEPAEEPLPANLAPLPLLPARARVVRRVSGRWDAPFPGAMHHAADTSPNRGQGCP